ncbi:MAG: cysteine--tRNA ligase [Planctomycetota bacterium]|nr:cysteine--tRNA ligase [Planctomycetota bacterium]
MVIQVHDSLSRTLKAFEPLEPGRVRLYLCGPTVYDDCHIGHLMGPVLFDTIARWLQARGYEVRFVNNITDIDDKIIRRALAEGRDWKEVAETYTAEYFDLLATLGVATITDHPRCTDFVPQMIGFIAELIDADRAYVAEDGVYYDVQRQPGYGKLSGRNVEDMIAGARIEVQSSLRHPADFALWKFAKPGEPSWESPWGAGRPGWHIECSVMASELLGPVFDIHAGGEDLKFPHHENEIAQSEAHGDAYAQCWLHNGLIQYGGKKIAKSDPRMQDPAFSQQFQARWLLGHYGAPAVRFFLLRGHYRRPIDFEPQNLEAARTGLVRLARQLGALGDEPLAGDPTEVLGRALEDAELLRLRDRFCSAMDEDFGTGEALGHLFSVAHHAGRLDGDAQQEALRLLRDLGRVLGMFMPGDLARLEDARRGDDALSAVAAALIEVRQDARARRDFATADAVRDALEEAGLAVLDGADGTTFELRAAGSDILDRVLDAALAIRRSARAGGDYATSDAIRDRLAAAGVKILDGAEGSRWELG